MTIVGTNEYVYYYFLLQLVGQKTDNASIKGRYDPPTSFCIDIFLPAIRFLSFWTGYQ